MTRLVKIILIASTIFFINGKKITKKHETIKYIKVVRVSSVMLTPGTVTCEDFDKEFIEHTDTLIIIDRKRINFFINNLKNADSTPSYNVDVRMKMFVVYQSGKIDSVCMAMTKVFSINGTVMFLRNRDLIDSIMRLK